MRKLIILLIFGYSISLPSVAEAICIRCNKEGGKLQRAAVNAAKNVATVATTGPAVAIKILDGEKPIDAVKGATSKDVEILMKPAVTAAGLDQALEDALKKHVGKSFGDAIEIARLPEKLVRNVAIETGKTFGQATKDGKPGEVVGIPVAAVIAQAIQQYKGRAKPIPEKVRSMLSAYSSI
jgi:hypothetical protein